VKSNAIYIALVAAILQLACKKLVQVPPPGTQLTSDNVYATNATATSVLTGIYTVLPASSMQIGSTIDAISLVSALSADELILDGGAANGNALLVQFYRNALTPGLATASSSTIWSDIYSDIYIANVAIERLGISTGLTFAVRQQLTGEAKFLRAFFYFYLLNLYGNVPLVTKSNYAGNAFAPVASAGLVYNQIISDLSDAQKLLTDNYVGPDALSSTSERVRPNRWAAKALLSRVYLYTKNWDSAKILSSEVIGNTGLYGLTVLNGAFLKNSREAIWQLQPVNAGWNTEDARLFILPASGPTTNSAIGYPVYLSNELLSSFESGDQRKAHWVDSVIVSNSVYYYSYKYKSASINAPITEYVMVLRLAEQYLIRAEAEANEGGSKINSAIADLDTIRARAGLPNYSGGNDLVSLSAAILHERQVELFTEWGHRWLDLKRTNGINKAMGMAEGYKGIAWRPEWQYYPIPLYDITEDPNLVQNQGY